MTAALVVVALAVGLALTWWLEDRAARDRDDRRVVELTAELSALADPAGVAPAQVQRAPLCCAHGKCAPVLSRHQEVSAPAAEVMEFYTRALERGGWQARSVPAEPATRYFHKDVGGRSVTASVTVGGQPPTAVVGMSFDAESC